MSDAIVPERIDAGPAVLVLHGAERAAEVADAINESLDHLRPWMSWAQRPTTVHEQALRLAVAVERARAGGDAVLSIVDRDTDDITGGCGLHERGPANTREIGYWLRAGATGRGLATAAAAGLTRVAFDVVGVDEVRITCDEANIASAAVPRRLGFTHVETRIEPRGAPGDTDRTMVWVLTRASWSESHAATFAVSYSS